MLDNKGYTFRKENRVLKISKGSLEQMKGYKENGLYILDGKTVVGSLSVASREISDYTTMSHNRLGHISERGLKELSRQGLLGKSKMGNLGSMNTVYLENQLE